MFLPQKSLPEQYLSLFENEHRSGIWHQALLGVDLNAVKTFLLASMDEVRLYYAEECARQVLSQSDLDDSSYFRRAVLMRELASSMGYQKQRDHAAHTLHNYLLGYVFFDQSKVIRDAAEIQCAARFQEESESAAVYFASLWPITSLLHDIGYLFEGGLNAHDVSLVSRTAVAGAEYANEFFKHQFWQHLGLDTKELKRQACELAGVETPDLRKHSLLEIADALRTLPGTTAINRYLQAHKGDSFSLGKLPELSRDAFDLWEQHYRAYGCDSMAERVKDLRLSNAELLNNGLPGLGIRVLDHGIYGALLQLQVSTLWFEIYCTLPEVCPADAVVGKLWKQFGRDTIENDPKWLWAGVVWSTAAVAFHNVAQSKVWPGLPQPKRLRVEEDFLTYLGVLVDVLEEWDRYSMTRNSVFTGKQDLPIQARDVNIGVTADGIVQIQYPTEAICAKVIKALGEALEGWDRIVEITAADQKTSDWVRDGSAANPRGQNRAYHWTSKGNKLDPPSASS